jgi:predicted AlkP superfamily phosphohydrolase/phosphomutase
LYIKGVNISTKLLIIGIDGATFNVIRPLSKSGYLPNLTKFMKEGTSGELLSTMPPISGPAWHAFKTGKKPGQTGVYDFMRYDPQSYQTRLIQIAKIQGLRLWDIIEFYSDFKIGIYNLPTTYPPDKIKGFMVAGFPLPDDVQDYTYPLKLKSELDELTGGHRVDIRFKNYKSCRDFLEAANEIIDQRVKIYHYLKEKYNPELFIFVFTSTDRIQHHMWKYMDPNNPPTDSKGKHYRKLLQNYWKHLDGAVGELLSSVDESTTVIVMSDHGFGPQAEMFYINKWLLNHGYLKLKEKKEWSKSSKNSLKCKLREMLKCLKFPGVLRYFTKKIIKRYLNEEIPFQKILPHIDWSQTQAYTPPHTSVFGTIYLNLKGREGKGSVDQCDYDNLRNKLILELQSLNDEIPSLEIGVFKREDLYKGRHLEEAPDLVYVINNFRCISQTSICEGEPFKTESLGKNYSGTHRLEGIFIAKGPYIKQEHWIGQSEITDITPTVLHILNIPILNDTDGKVLKEIFTPNSELARRKVNLVNVKNEIKPKNQALLSDQKIYKFLEDLGYL